MGYKYRPIADAPTDGTPIIAVCGGVEMAVVWDEGGGFLTPGWFHFDETEGGTTYERVKDDLSQWREIEW